MSEENEVQEVNFTGRESMAISRIEVSFATPVELTDKEMQVLSEIVNRAARRTETNDIVHWQAGIGSKPNWSKSDCRIWGFEETADSPETGEPTFDDSILFIETCARERYDTERPCANCGIDGWKHRGYDPKACKEFAAKTWVRGGSQ